MSEITHGFSDPAQLRFSYASVNFPGAAGCFDAPPVLNGSAKAVYTGLKMDSFALQTVGVRWRRWFYYLPVSSDSNGLEQNGAERSASTPHRKLRTRVAYPPGAELRGTAAGRTGAGSTTVRIEREHLSV